ncbi:phosphoethanolamine methyltransferase [Latimeria chalumnae]|uniref:phosphoethanolamine methyltransferase n=1 Tax=Latimeria chalumnae TaxID=7897 RepID=UPI00313B41D5
MKQFWEEHSKEASVEEMMLDSNAQAIAEEDRSEIIAMLPCVEGKDVLELGAGIGRFSGQLAKKARRVTAVDFMKTFMEKNREVNKVYGNVTFLQADVTNLDLPPNSFDLIFSNWLFMYLTDKELVHFTNKLLQWLRPGGYLFFRESCFFKLGSLLRSFDPTYYRAPADYNCLLTSSVQTLPGDESYGFEIVMSKSVQIYLKIRKCQNQVCWLLQKVLRKGSANQGYATFQQFLDNKQYSRQGILRYEKIFGRGFISTGGLETTKEFVEMLNLQPGQKVLDIGCGIGGGDFYMAKKYGVDVLGIDLSSNVVAIAMERAVAENTPLVQFEIGDATKRKFPAESFDVVYSRDTILHISDKLALFRRFYSWLKPGGKVLISDYCCGEKPWSDIFEEYVSQRGYILHTPQKYGKFLEEAGFVSICMEDRTTQFVQVLKVELQRTEQMKEEFIKEFSEEDYSYIVDGWREKLQRCELGDQRWGLFYTQKPEGDKLM